MDTTVAIIIFMGVALFLGIFAGVAVFLCSFPGEKAISKRYKGLVDSTVIAKKFFYFQRAVGYGNLFMFCLSYSYLLKILGAIATVITVYCAFIKAEGFVLLFALLASACNIIHLTVPFDRLLRKFSTERLKMEDILFGNVHAGEHKQYHESEKSLYEN